MLSLCQEGRNSLIIREGCKPKRILYKQNLLKWLSLSFSLLIHTFYLLFYNCLSLFNLVYEHLVFAASLGLHFPMGLPCCMCRICMSFSYSFFLCQFSFQAQPEILSVEVKFCLPKLARNYIIPLASLLGPHVKLHPPFLVLAIKNHFFFICSLLHLSSESG